MKKKIPPIDVNEKPVLRPADLAKHWPRAMKNWKCSPRLVLCFSFLEKSLTSWLKWNRARKTGMHRACSSIYELDGPAGAVTIAFMNGMGAPLSALLLEEMIYLGARFILLFGICGVLDRKIPRGAPVVPGAAFCDEGTSAHYLENPVEIKTDARLHKALCRELEAGDVSLINGHTWTTDAVYRETRSRIQAFRKMGAVCVDNLREVKFKFLGDEKGPTKGFLY